MSVQIITEAEIDRLFFENLRKEVVAQGYLPDVLAAPDETAYKLAKDNLRASLTTTIGERARLIEVFGVGSEDSRGAKSNCKIVINRKGGHPGSIGGFPETYLEVTSPDDAEPKDTKWSKYFYPDKSKDIDFEIRLSGDSTYYDRIMCDILENVLPQRRFINTVGNNGEDTGNSVLVVYKGDIDMSNENYMERIYRYTVEDVFVARPRLIKANIPVMTTVKYFTYNGYDETDELSNIINIH